MDGGYITRLLLESITRTSLGNHIANQLELPRHPWQDELMAAAWPVFVGVNESTLGVAPRQAKEFWNFFAEFLRQGVLFYLGEGKRLNIEIPVMNNPKIHGTGIALRTLQQWMGHASVVTTERYASFLPRTRMRLGSPRRLHGANGADYPRS